MLGTTLLIAGLMFPTLSLLTCIASLATRWRQDRYPSSVFIPFVGPVLLTCWVVVEGRTRWLIPLVWLLDLGTIAFLVVLPRLTLEWWQISVFTRLMTLRGSHGIEKVILTLHQGGRYFLKKTWDRSHGEPGIVGLCETGTFIDDGDVITLESHHGLTRRLQRADTNTFDVAERESARQELQNHSLNGWRLFF